MRIVALVAALLLPALAQAGTIEAQKEARAVVINGLGLNSTRWTGWIDVGRYRQATFEVAYTWSAATAVTMRCETSDDASTANDSGFDLHILSDSATAGTSDSVTHTWSNAVTASESWTWTVANLPHNWINCAFAGTSAGAGDTAIVAHKRTSP